jgi:hypothetical protein
MSVEQIERFPNAAAVITYLNKHERKYNKPLDIAWISFDARDEIVKYAIEDRRFVHTVKDDAGSVGLEWMGSSLFPFNKLSGGEICLRVDTSQ